MSKGCRKIMRITYISYISYLTYGLARQLFSLRFGLVVQNKLR
jgi:hypothetical protein